MTKEMMKKYKESLAKTPGPVPDSEIPRVRSDYHGLRCLAEQKGVGMDELSYEETLPFLTELAPGELAKVAAVFQSRMEESVMHNITKELRQEEREALSRLYRILKQENKMEDYDKAMNDFAFCDELLEKYELI